MLKLTILGYERSLLGIRPSFDKLRVIREYATLTDDVQLEHFLHLLPYFSDNCPGRADLSTIMRTAVKHETKLVEENGSAGE